MEALLNKIFTPIMGVLLFLTFMFRSPLAAIGIVLVMGAYVFIHTALSAVTKRR